MWAPLSPALVCGPPGRFFDVSSCVSLETEGDGNGFVGKSTRASEMKDVRFSMSPGGRKPLNLRK